MRSDGGAVKLRPWDRRWLGIQMAEDSWCPESYREDQEVGDPMALLWARKAGRGV